MKRFPWPVFRAIVVLAVSTSPFLHGANINPVFAAPEKNVSAQETITASAVVVPAQVSELGFVISGIARDISVDEGERVEAGQTLMVLDTPELQFAVAEAEASLRAARAQAEIRRDEIRKKFVVVYRRNDILVQKLRLSVPHEEIEIAEGKVQQAQAALEIAQAGLAQGTLTAPFDGVVTSIYVIPGEFVQSDRAVITLAALKTLQVETTDLSERDIPNVQVGDAASIVVEALNETIGGTVVAISPKAEIVGGDVVFRVTIAPDEQPEGLLWGMTAEVQIQGGK